MRPETKLWHDLKKSTPQIKWTRLESSASFGLPDLLGYNKIHIFFTVELKIIYANKIRFSPHQIAFHVRHPKNTFILASAQAPSSVKLYPGAMILELRKELVGGSHPYFFIFFSGLWPCCFGACGLIIYFGKVELGSERSELLEELCFLYLYFSNFLIACFFVLNQ